MLIFYEYSGDEAYYYDFTGYTNMAYVGQRLIGCRPVLTYSDSNFTFNLANGNKDVTSDLLEIEYGYYPQSIVSDDIQKELKLKYKNNNLTMTKSKYTIDSTSYEDTESPFFAEEIIEYEYNGERYVRVKANFIGTSYNNKYSNGNFIWIKVEPIKWLVEPNKQRIISKNILFAGIQFNNSNEIENGFEKSNIKKFLNTCFLKEITQNMNLENKYEDFEDAIIRLNKQIKK